MPLISVIVPAYNVQRYIEKSVNCLINQEYKKIEIILVDDGSKDETGKKCDELKKIDDRIKVIHKKNGGLSSARNAGLEVATGDYIFFLDADDYIEKEYLNECVKELKNQRVDLLFTPYIREYHNKSIRTSLFTEEKIIFDNPKAILKLQRRLFGPLNNEEKEPTKLNNFNTAWGKLYSRKIIKEIRFEKEAGSAEDLWFNINIMLNVKKAEYFGRVFLHYNRTNEESIVSVFKVENIYAINHVQKLMFNFIKKNNLPENFFEALNNRIILNLFSKVLQLSNSELKYKNIKKYIVESVQSEEVINAFKQFKFSHMNIEWLIFFKLAYFKLYFFMYSFVVVAKKIRGK